MKRGRKGSLVQDTLKELLKNSCNEGFFPWKVVCDKRRVFCFARTQADAMRKVMVYLCKAVVCTVEEIVNAVKDKDSDAEG